METTRDILAAHPYFEGMEPQHLDLIVTCAAYARYEPGDIIFHQGEDANHFFIIQHGQVRLELAHEDSRPFTISTLCDGDALGWSWLIPPYRWQFDARAVEVTRAITLDAGCLRRKCDDHKDLGYELLKRLTGVLVQRLQDIRYRLLDVYSFAK